MSDPTRCRGLDADGQQCICLRADNTYVGEDKKTKCSQCDHIASAHPEVKPSVTSFVKTFRDAAKVNSSSSSSGSGKASHQEAAAETSAGLRSNTKKRKSDSHLEAGSTKKVNKSKGGKEKTVTTEYGKAVMLTCGLTDDGESLRSTRTPSSQDLQEMRRYKLVVLSTPTHPLVIDSSWSNEDVNDHIAKLFPEPIGFLSRQHPDERQLWLGVTTHKGVLTLAGDSFPTGVEVADYFTKVGRPARDRILYIVSKFKIPKRNWGWPEPDSEDLGRVISTLFLPRTLSSLLPGPSLVLYKGKGKSKATAPAIKMEAATESNLEPLEEEEDESDMCKAAKIRTRLSSGTIQRQTVFIPGSDEEVVVVSDTEDNQLRPLTAEDNEDPPALVSWQTNAPSSGPSIPSLYDDFISTFPPPPTAPVASSSSSAFAANFSTWVPTSAAALPLIPLVTTAPLLTSDAIAATSGTSSDTSAFAASAPVAPPAVAGEAGHRFTRMGRGRR
ncbi:hypothetical protein C8R45DRAFT_1077085 [Mycena sanguinolenta]|nr:hypothetical protein C8R45DRAFT_1077085 [Mycena sanguinolenta]